MQLRAPSVTDGYKLSHASMYADGTTKVYSNLTPRSDKIYRRNCTQFYDGKLVWVGAQGAVQEIKELWDDFFCTEKEVVVNRFARRMAGYLGGFDPAVKVIAELHDIGYLPLTFKSLPEGSKVSMGVPVITVTNTLPQFYWLVNYLETVISDLTWKTATNATIAAEYKAICKHYAELTGTDDFTVSIQCHDFSMRGMSGPEDAARSGFAHLTSFIGTDTLPAMDYAEDYYDADPDSLIAISVPATEHAVATSNILGLRQRFAGKAEGNSMSLLVAEQLFMKDLITRKFPTGIVSYVADSYDFWGVLTDVLPALRDVIVAREASAVAPGKLVIRPDSGDPVQVICGTLEGAFATLDEAIEEINEAHYKAASEACEGSYNMGNDEYTSTVYVKDEAKYYELSTKFEYNRHDKQYYYIDNYSSDAGKTIAKQIEPTPEQKGAIQLLWETFGGTETDKGYKLLDSHIGLIYGDSITTKRAEEILRRLADRGFASGNIVFGVGSYTYQCNTRDTFGFAVKATYTEVGEEGIAIFKDPKTDSKKKSAKGLLMVAKQDGEYMLVDDVNSVREASGWLETIFEDGKFVRRTTLDEIRARIA
ncbi:putative nicotinate phosphoribosyltransferase [compost metagenome]